MTLLLEGGARTMDERYSPDRRALDELALATVAAMPDPVVLIDATASLLWANPAAERRFGRRLEEDLGASLVHLVHPDDVNTALVSLQSVQAKAVGTVVELRLRDASDEYFRFEVRGAGVDVAGERAVVLCLRESTDRRRWEIGAGDPDLLTGVLDAMSSLTVLLGRDGTVRGANRSLTRLLGRPLEDTLGRPFVDVVDRDDRSTVLAELALVMAAPGRRSFEARLATTDHGSIPFALTVVNLLDDRAVEGLVVSGEEITPLVHARERLRHLATHDDLTGLPNRAALRDLLEELTAAGDCDRYSVIFGDVDGLKQINDRYGHGAGDAVLHATAERLRRVLRPEDVVARVSGDEFAIVAATTDPTVLVDLQARIDEAMREPISVDGGDVTVSITTGGAPLRGRSVADALAAADRAMYRAKLDRRPPDR